MNDFLKAVEIAGIAAGEAAISLTQAKRTLQRNMIAAIVEGECDPDQVKDKARDGLHKGLQSAKIRDGDAHRKVVNGIDQCISQAMRVVRGWSKLSATMKANVLAGRSPASAALAKIKEAEAEAKAPAEDKAPAQEPAQEQEQEQEQEQDSTPAEDGRSVIARMADELRAVITDNGFDGLTEEEAEAIADLYEAIGNAATPAEEVAEAA